jgi:hypothetical protein
MKSSIQVFASLVAALATLSQSAIATPSSRVVSQNISSSSVATQAMTDSGKSSNVFRSFRVADRAVIIDSDAISVGSKNRTTILKCSESQPCIEDLLVIDSYKENFGSDGKIKGASIVMYNTSYAPTAIEVYNSKGEFKSVDFVDGKKGGFKDIGDYLKTAASGIIEPFACVAGKAYQQCLNDLKNGKSQVTKAEKQLKLQAGDVVRISRGSEPARLYALMLQGLEVVDLLMSARDIKKSNKYELSLAKNFSPELKRQIIAGYIKEKMNSKYTWNMLLKEFGYEANKKAIGNNLDLFGSTLEVARNIPEDFWKATTDSTIASKVAGDGLSLIIESVSSKASLVLDSALFVSQATNILVRSITSENAYKNPYPLVIAYEKPIKDKAPRVTAAVNNPEVQKTAAEIQSVSQVKGYLQELMSPCSSGCSGYGLHLRAVRICTLVQALDVKTGGKILQGQSLNSNQKNISINKTDRDLMKMIYGQCKLYKRLPSDSSELTYIPTANARQKIENSLLKADNRMLQDTQASSEVKYQLCGDFPQWKRPTKKEQENKLRSYGRYDGVSIENGYWKSDVVIFDDYGNSLLQDARIYTGLWKPLGGKLKCSIFNNDVPSIVSKQIAVGWIFNHKIEKIHYQNNIYIITLSPIESGIVFFKFPRVEKKDKILLSVTTKNGKKIPYCTVSGKC